MKASKGVRIGLALMVLGAMGCASQRQLTETPPFRISEPSVQDWLGGREASGSGTELRMRWAPEDPEAFRPDTLYFRGRALVPEIRDSETGMWLVASYSRISPEKPDRVMHADAGREVGNQPPLPLEDQAPIPFKLERDQAVLAYVRKADGKQFYYRITGIKEKPVKAMQGRPQE